MVNVGKATGISYYSNYVFCFSLHFLIYSAVISVLIHNSLETMNYSNVLGSFYLSKTGKSRVVENNELQSGLHPFLSGQDTPNGSSLTFSSLIRQRRETSAILIGKADIHLKTVFL